MTYFHIDSRSMTYFMLTFRRLIKIHTQKILWCLESSNRRIS